MRNTGGRGRWETDPRHAGDDEALAKIVGRIFRTAREEQHLSQEQVAALSSSHAGGVSRALISAIERGRSLPGIEALVSVSRVLNVEPREILERVDLSGGAPVDVAGRTPLELKQKGLDAFFAGDYREALKHYDAAAELISEEHDDSPRTLALRVWIEIDRAVALRRATALRAAQRAAENAVELTMKVPELRAEAYMALSSVLSQEGLHVLARDIAERALAASDSADRRKKCQAWAQLGGTLVRAHEFEEALRAFRPARDLAMEIEDVRQQLKIEGNIGTCLMELGRSRQARSQYKKAVDLARKCGDRTAEALWLVGLGRIAQNEQRHDEAESCCRLALRIAKPLGQRLTIFRAEWLLYQVLRLTEPKRRDRHRLAYLKKLWRELKDCRGHEEIREFEDAVMRRTGRREDES